MTDAVLTYGSLDLLNQDDRGLHAYGDAFDLGAPEPLLTALPRLLLDGEIVSGSRSSNRELRFLVEIHGADALALAEAEADLVREVEKPRNVLTWKPPGGIAPASVFDTFRGQVRQVFDDRGELNTRRVFEVTLPALPSAMSENEVTFSSVGEVLTPTTTTLDACDSLTGWTVDGSKSPSLALDSATYRTAPSSIRGQAEAPFYGGTEWLEMIRTATFSTTGTPYLRASVRGDDPGSQTLLLAAPTGSSVGSGDTVYPRVAYTYLGDSWYDVTWFLGEGSFDQVVFRGNLDLRVDNIRLTNDINSDTPKQRLFTNEIVGSMRAPARVQIAATDGVTDLGEVLFHVAEVDGSSPAMRRYRTSISGRTADATAVSGYRETIQTTHTTSTDFQVSLPAAAYRGAFVVMARVRWNVASPTGTTTLSAGPSEENATSSVVTRSAAWRIVPLGVVHLPDVATMPGSTRTFNFYLWGSSLSDSPVVDEVWLFPADGTLVHVENAAAPYLWVTSPTVDLPRPGVWLGDVDDLNRAWSAGVEVASLGELMVVPDEARFYVVTTGVNNPNVSGAYRPHWHTNAAL